ncbi:MAG: matrixin family metalloprotease [Chloroflexi bacterium]|nr:matrixin family metalloprotease [Chloroflexota bacterium]
MAAEHANNDPRSGPRALLAGFALTVATALVVLFAALTIDARAYELHGFRWETAVVGYEADASLQPYADSAAGRWGAVSGLGFRAGPEIGVVFAPLLPPIDHPGQAAQANVVQSGGRLTSCEIRVDQSVFEQLSEAARETVVAHEFGHCIGVNHSTKPGIMKNPMLYAFSEDDAEAARAIYGGPQATAASHGEGRYRTIAAGVASAR